MSADAPLRSDPPDWIAVMKEALRESSVVEIPLGIDDFHRAQEYVRDRAHGWLSRLVAEVETLRARVAQMEQERERLEHVWRDCDERADRAEQEQVRLSVSLTGRARDAEEEVQRLIRVLDDFAHAAHAVLDGPSYVGTTEADIAAARHRLAVFAGKYDLPVSGVPQEPT